MSIMLQAILGIITHIAIPVGLAFLFFFWKPKTKLDAILVSFFYALYEFYFFMTGHWNYISFYTRYILLVLCLVAIVFMLLRTRKQPFYQPGKLKHALIRGIGLIVIVLFINAAVGICMAFVIDDTPVHLAFPLKGGVYAVFEGGNGDLSPSMNYHYTSEGFKRMGINTSMKFATDIEKLNSYGNTRNGLFPTDFNDYTIYNATIYSPCDGEVVSVENSLDNIAAYSDKKPFNLGNRIIIKTGDVYVAIGHILKGSITPKVGDQVTQGESIAQVGCSGLADCPHVHIQAMKASPVSTLLQGDDAVWFYEGVPILFDNILPVKNSLYFEQ